MMLFGETCYTGCSKCDRQRACGGGCDREAVMVGIREGGSLIWSSKALNCSIVPIKQRPGCETYRSMETKYLFR